MKEKLEELYNLENVWKQIISKILGITREHFYKVKKWTYPVSERIKWELEKWRFKLVEETKNWKVFIFIEKK